MGLTCDEARKVEKEHGRSQRIVTALCPTKAAKNKR